MEYVINAAIENGTKWGTELQFALNVANKMNIIYMLYYIYSKKYGWAPLKFLLTGKNFYKERDLWKSTYINQKEN